MKDTTDLRQLRYFLAVADAGQLTAAAAALGIQQPPLSQQIAGLERQLGLRLFDRHAKGVTLTEGGRLVAAEARRLLVEPVAGVYEWAPDALKSALTGAEGRPYRLQQLGLVAVQRMLAGGRTRITLQDVQGAIQASA